MKKLDKWIPYELNEKPRQNGLEVCLMLPFHHKSDPFLNRIIIFDGKWIQYGNRKCSPQWLDKDESPKPTPKRSIHQKKLMVNVWRSSAGVGHYKFIKQGSSITAEIYCNQLDKMMLKLKGKQPRLVNRPTPILVLDNAGPYATRMTTASFAICTS